MRNAQACREDRRRFHVQTHGILQLSWSYSRSHNYRRRHRLGGILVVISTGTVILQVTL